MATVTGFTAERMQAIEDDTITSGLVDVNGNLLLYPKAGDPVNAGSVRGPKGDAGYHVVGPIPYTGPGHYMRLATIDGLSTQAGGHINFLLSGLGNYGTARRATVLVHATQRGSNIINVRTWGWGFEDSALPLSLYTRQVSEFLFEIWGLFAPFNMAAGMTVLAKQSSTINIDSATSVAPSSLVAVTIDRADSWNSLKDKPSAMNPTPHAHFASDIVSGGGVISDGVLPGRLYGGNLGTGVNANNLLTTGWYSGYGWVNAPVNTIGILRAEVYSADWLVQTFHVIGDGSGREFQRIRHSGTTWTAWELQGASVLVGRMGIIPANNYVPISEVVAGPGFTLTNTTTITVIHEGAYSINMSQLVGPVSPGYYQVQINNVNTYHAYAPGAMEDLHINIIRSLTAGSTIRFFWSGAAPSYWTGTHTDLSIAKLS